MRANGNTLVTISWKHSKDTESRITLEEAIDRIGGRLSSLQVLHMIEGLNQRGSWSATGYFDIKVVDWDDGAGGSTDDPNEWHDGRTLLQVTENTAPYFVAVYLVDKEYGGPEEGGWWYEAGRPVLEPNLPKPVWHNSLAEAERHRDLLQKSLDAGVNKERRSISSVLSQGEYRAVVDAGWPLPFPVSRPRYE